MNIREEKRVKGEMLLNAIGKLPDEMVVCEDMEELKTSAEIVKKQERNIVILKRCAYAAVVAVCAALLVVSANLLKYPGGHDINCGPDESQNTALPDKDTSIHLFATAVKTEALSETAEKKSNGNGSFSGGKENANGNSKANLNISNMLKEFPEGSTRKMLLIQTGEDNAIDVKDSGKVYIVFMPGIDIYFTLSYENSGTYILDKEGNKKSYKKEQKVLCNAGSEVYFDISGAEHKTDMLQGIDIPGWKEKGIDIIAFVKMYLPEGYEKTKEVEGTFYIGRKNNDGDILYYGMYKSEDSCTESGADNNIDSVTEKIENKGAGNTGSINKKTKDNVVFYNNVPVYGKSDKKKIKKYLSSLPDNITEKKAKKMGIIIDSYIYKKKNTFKKEWTDFYKYVKKGEDACRPENVVKCYAEPYMAAIVILEYTIEGDACYKYISFIEGSYYVFEDTSRDKYKAGSWDGYSEIGTYKFLKKRKEEYKPLKKEKYMYLIEYSLFKKMDITNKEIKKILNENSSYVRKYYNVFGYYK